MENKRFTSDDPGLGIILAKDVMLPMRDGIHLATDIYRPAKDGEPLSGRFPTILCRTPYNKTDRRYAEIADYFTPRGFVTVLQDLRDRYRSEGRGNYYHTANADEGLDGYDTVEWIANQKWSNGKVGTVGSSFAAVVQVQMALERPPHLSAIWPDVTPTNNYHHQAREGGAMQLHMFWALFLHAQDAQEIAHDVAAQDKIWADLRHIRQLVYQTPFEAGQTSLALVPNLENVLLDYYRRGNYDRFWAEPRNNFEALFEQHADIPAIYSGGWFDPYSIAMTDYYATMSQQNRTPQRLIMGPWTHVGMRGESSFSGDVDFGLSSVWGVSRYFREQLRFFSRWLMESESGTEEIPERPVAIFVMGGGSGRRMPSGKLDHGGEWREEDEWPLARTRYTPYYFHANGSLQTDRPEMDDASLEFDFDPSHPVPTVGGNLCGIMEIPEDGGELDQMWRRFMSPVTRLRHVVPPGPAHQQEGPEILGSRDPYPLLAERHDTIVFQTEPLAADVEVTGPIQVKLWIASSALDTDFTAKLLDIYPPHDDYPHGYHMNLTDSIIRVRYRNGWEQESLIEPGEVYAVEIRLHPTSNRFAAGHRIRVDISSSNFPRLDVNPNTGEPMGAHTATVIARNTVYMDRSRPSHIVLPIIPDNHSSNHWK